MAQRHRLRVAEVEPLHPLGDLERERINRHAVRPCNEVELHTWYMLYHLVDWTVVQEHVVKASVRVSTELAEYR